MADAALVDVVREALGDKQILALTLFGEARGEAVEGRIAVANVIANRLKRGTFGATIAAVCLAPSQFSCWWAWGGASNYDVMQAMAEKYLICDMPPVGTVLAECEWIAHGVIRRAVLDNTKGAVNYYAPAAMTPPGRVPMWAEGKTPCAMVGRHLFFTT